MRHLGLALLLVAGLPATAQTVTFRSGNHPGFVRLVLDIPAGTPWDLGRSGEDYALDLGPGFDFDLSGIFERIPRDRLAGIAAAETPGRLTLNLACPCHATAFLFQPDKLVIDVVDGPPPGDSPWEDPVMAGTPAAPPDFPLISALPPATLLFDPATEPAPGQDNPLLDDLAADMARAVSTGLLDAAVTVPEPVAVTEASPGPAPALPAATQSLPEGPVRPGVNFITADRMQRTTPGARDIGRNGQPCTPESEFDFVAWGPTGDFARDVGDLRREVVDAAGAPDEAVLTSLARAYLHFGFGAEARQTLALVGEESTTTRRLGTLADLIDGRPVAPGAFADQAGCLTAATLWSALAEGSIDGRSAAERTAIEAAFRVLPAGPRQAVAPRLAALFLAAGQTESASTMMARMPAGGARSDEAVAVESDIMRDTASAAAARETLLTAIEAGSRTSADTMTRLVDATLAAGMPVDPWMVDTLTALRFEYRDSPIAGRLAVSEVRALTAMGRFEEARSLLNDTDLPVAAAERTSLSAEFALAIADRGSDSQFLDFVFGDAPDVPPGPAANAVATRLIALGFPDVALELLGPAAGGDGMEDRRRLRADALRALGQDEEAALILAGMTDRDAGAADPDAAWRAGDWDAMTQGDDPLLTEVAAAVLDEAPPPVAEDSLADRAALIGAAEETRKLAEALLERFPPPGAAPPLPGATE